MEKVKRFIPDERGSFFLFGPRGTGKTTWLNEHFPDAFYLDLLDDRMYRRYLTRPESLKEAVDLTLSRRKNTLIVDEIQKVPALLSLVHQQMERHKELRFILTGSSARKLKREGVDLLAGRALFKQAFPFMAAEIPGRFHLEKQLETGLLPVVLDSQTPNRVLNSYISLYLKEEVQQEGLVRNIEGFSRFLETVSFSHGTLVNVSEIAREADVSRKTVEGYIQVSHDLLLSREVPVFSRRAKRILVKHNKFYFFDCGVFHSLRPKGPLDRSEEIEGAALEGLVLQHLSAWLHYGNRDGKIYFWRTKSGSEVDFVLYGADLFAALEVKNSDRIRNKDLTGLKSFKTDYPEAKSFLLYRGEEERNIDGISCLPVESFLLNLLPEKPLPLYEN